MLLAGRPPSSPATAVPPLATRTHTAAGDSSGAPPQAPTFTPSPSPFRGSRSTLEGEDGGGVTRQPTTPPPPTFTPTGTRTRTPTATRTQTPVYPVSGGRGLIAFTTGLDGRSQIQLYDPAGKTFSALKGQHANSSVPSFSWDGRTIFYKATTGGSDHQVFSIPAAGGTPTQLTREGDNGEAVLSPDGSLVAYARTIAEKDKDLSLMDAQGRSQRKVFNDIYWDDDPQWCSDGWLVFESSRDDHKCPGCTGIFIMNPSSSSTLFHVTRNTVTAEEYTPACSPDGSKIAFEGRMNGEVITHIWLVNRDGSGATRLTSGLHEERPAFSPDGKELAYTQREAGGAEAIYILALDGSHPPLRVGSGRDAAWSRPPGN